MAKQKNNRVPTLLDEGGTYLPTYYRGLTVNVKVTVSFTNLKEPIFTPLGRMQIAIQLKKRNKTNI